MSGYLIKYGGKIIANTENHLYSPVSATIDQQKDTADSFNFTLPRNHEFVNLPNIKDKVVRVIDDTGTIYAGDILSIETNSQGDRTFNCCGVLDWLKDALVYGQSATQTTSNEYFQRIVNNYNAINDVRLLTAGRCAYTTKYTPEEYLGEYKTTAELLQDFQGDKGGTVWVDYSGDTILLNIADYRWNRRTFEVSSNDLLTDFSVTVDGSGVATRVIPVGKDGLRIVSVNDGKAYVLSHTDILYGMIAQKVDFEKTSTAEKLLERGQRKANKLGEASKTIEATVANLYGSDRIRVGDIVKVYGGDILNVTETECVGVTIDLVNPSNSTATLGATQKTLTSIVNSR